MSAPAEVGGLWHVLWATDFSADVKVFPKSRMVDTATAITGN
jgi:hypothetical protein